MSVIIVFYFLTILGVLGFPVPHIEQRAPSSCNDLNDRTMWKIVWSCLATIFAATWISAHPNIPDPPPAGQGYYSLKRWFRIASPRLQIMVTGLIAPELVIIWAYRQNRMAAKLANDYEEWGMSHGFFAVMGGFMFYKDKKPLRTFSPEDLYAYFPRRGTLSVPKIDILKEEIQDRSKGDFLAKAIAIGQAGWFALQCVARRMEQLPLTDLELVTLAFAIPNAVIYGIWWYKPINVQQPYRVLVGKDAEEVEGEENAKEADAKAIWNATWNTIWRAAYNLVPTIHDPSHSTLKGLMNSFMTESRLDRDMGWVDLGNVKRVPIWYAGNGRGKEEEKILQHAIYVGVAIATIFGAIHCIGWSFEFPSRTELLLWRLSSTAITCIPFLVFVVYHFGSREDSYLGRVLGAMSVSCVLLYFLSRVAILVLAFSALRSLPQKAYQGVRWHQVISPT